MRILAALLMLSFPASASALRVRANMTGDMSIGPVSTTSTSISPTFDVLFGSTGPNDLSDTLTVNGIAMTLALACDAQGISGSSWVCRDASGAVTLAEAGTGSSPVQTILTPFHALDATERGAQYIASGKRHDAPSTSTADFSTEDLVVEYVGKLGPTSGASIIDKGLAGVGGWRLSQSGTSAVSFQLRTSSTTSTATSPTGHTSSFVHAIAFVDRSEASTNGAIVYADGAAGTGVDFSARSATLSNSSTLSVGAVSGGASDSGLVSTIRVWKCSSCMAGGATNPTQWSLIARERTSVSFGLKPAVAVGTPTPTTLTRASVAFNDVVDGNVRQLYSIGSGGQRVSKRKDSSGNIIIGYLSEPASTNIILQSQTLETTWTALTVGDAVLTENFSGADLTTTGDDIDAVNATNAEHGVRQTSSILTAAPYTFSVWAKAGTQHHVYLRDNTIVSGFSFFNMDNCALCSAGNDCSGAVGTVGAGALQSRAERWPVDTSGDGVADVELCRVMITVTGTAATHDFDLGCANQDNNFTYTDNDSTADCGFWGVRLEQFNTATSYLATTTTSTARNADDLRYDGSGHYTGSPSTMAADILCPNFDTAADTALISVGTSTSEYARLFTASTDQTGSSGVVGGSSQWNLLQSVDPSNNATHSLRTTMATNAITFYTDALAPLTDNVANLPATASSFIYFGTSGGAAGATGCLISRARLWPALVVP